MLTILRSLRSLAIRSLAILCLLCASSLAQAVKPDEIIANQNRVTAGRFQDGVLSVQLELRSATWHAETDDGPPLFVQAFAETGHAAQIPGPLLRMLEGTIVHATVTNKLKMKATVYGLNTRPSHADAGVELAPGASHELVFLAGAPGTYYYWARTTDVLKTAARTIVQPLRADAQLNGALIVDPASAASADRIFVINTMVVAADAVHPSVEVLTINGKVYPYTERLEYTQGEHIRWRVLNPGAGEHPMHLHGSFFDVLSLGNFESDTAYATGDRQSVVTESLRPGTTMTMEWSPSHAGRWLFHCHLLAHISLGERLPRFTLAADDSATHAPMHARPDGMDPMSDMAGLVLLVNVKAASSSTAPPPARAPRKIDLVIERNAAVAKTQTFFCSLREGKKIVVAEDKSVGPPLVLTRDEAVEITVVNHLEAPTTIHWHGLELDSYYDGVMGGGDEKQVTPDIPPGSSFVARFTPNREGTFIYHAHSADLTQLSGGIYGALIVLRPGESFDQEHDRLFVIGARDNDFNTTRLTLNGFEELRLMEFRRGVKYRLRLINIAPNLLANVLVGTADHPATWRAVAKDGADLPPRLAIQRDAALRIDSGEVYDFEFQPDTPGETPFQIENELGKAKLSGKFVVRD